MQKVLHVYLLISERDLSLRVILDKQLNKQKLMAFNLIILDYDQILLKDFTVMVL